jgi:acetyltransferase-like isoleucine patch superfamily enzyme
MAHRLSDRLLTLLERDWRATRRLNARCGRPGSFVCRGRVQLHLAADAVVVAPSARCAVGVPLYGWTSRLSDTTVVSVGPGATLALDGATIGRGAVLGVGPGAALAVGAGTYLADGVRVMSSTRVEFGRGCAVAFGVTVLDDDGHGFGPPPYAAPILVGDHVWVGCNVTVLKGVTIGSGSVVAAGSVVTRSCPPCSLLAGVPARVVRENVEWTDADRLTRG